MEAGVCARALPRSHPLPPVPSKVGADAGPRGMPSPARRVGAPMTTWGFIGSGNIGSTVARLAVDAGHDVVLSNSRGPETLADLVAELGPHARAATAEEAARAGDVVVVTVPLKARGDLPHAALRRQGGHRHDELLPAARRRGARARGRVDHHLRAAAGARARREGGQGLQQHLRAAPRRPARARAGPTTAARWPSPGTTPRPRRSCGWPSTRSATTRSTSARSRRAGAPSATPPAYGSIYAKDPSRLDQGRAPGRPGCRGGRRAARSPLPRRLTVGLRRSPPDPRPA